MKAIILFMFVFLCSCEGYPSKEAESVTNYEGASLSVAKIKYEKHDYLVASSMGVGICHSESCAYCDSLNKTHLSNK